MRVFIPAFADFVRQILLSELGRAIISATVGGTVSVMVGVWLNYWLNFRLNHIQSIAEATHAVAADTNAVVKNGNGGEH